jgi:hypothetical protein
VYTVLVRGRMDEEGCSTNARGVVEISSKRREELCTGASI